MLRITELPKDRSVVELKLEGEIIGEWITLLEGHCTRLLQVGRKVELDFSEVRFIDCKAVDMLNGFNTGDLKIVRCPGAISDLITVCKLQAGVRERA